MKKTLLEQLATKVSKMKIPKQDPDMEPDWEGACEVCEQSPILPITGLCGPCTFGEAETIGGNW